MYKCRGERRGAGLNVKLTKTHVDSLTTSLANQNSFNMHRVAMGGRAGSADHPHPGDSLIFPFSTSVFCSFPQGD